MPNSSGIVVQCLGITDLKLLYSPTLLSFCCLLFEGGQPPALYEGGSFSPRDVETDGNDTERHKSSPSFPDNFRGN